MAKVWALKEDEGVREKLLDENLGDYLIVGWGTDHGPTVGQLRSECSLRFKV